MDFQPAVATAATTDVVDSPVAADAVTFAAAAAAASAVHADTSAPTAAPVVPRGHRIMPRFATGGDGGSNSTEDIHSSSGLPTTIERITNDNNCSGAKFDYMIFLYSGAAACTADAVAFPFDTAKTRSVRSSNNTICDSHLLVTVTLI